MGLFKGMKDMKDAVAGAKELGDHHGGMPSISGAFKDIKALSAKKHREASGTFMAEGLKLVLDALETGWKIETLIYSKAGKGKPLVEKAAARTIAAGGLVLEVSEKVLSSVTSSVARISA